MFTKIEIKKAVRLLKILSFIAKIGYYFVDRKNKSFAKLSKDLFTFILKKNLSYSWETVEITDLFLFELLAKFKVLQVKNYCFIGIYLEIAVLIDNEIKNIRFVKERYKFDLSGQGKMFIIPIFK